MSREVVKRGSHQPLQTKRGVPDAAQHHARAKEVEGARGGSRCERRTRDRWAARSNLLQKLGCSLAVLVEGETFGLVALQMPLQELVQTDRRRDAGEWDGQTRGRWENKDCN